MARGQQQLQEEQSSLRLEASLEEAAVAPV